MQILVFYSLFYTGLAALFSICLQGMLATLDENVPKRQQDDGLIGTNPGLGFRPISDKVEEGSLIWYNVKNDTSVNKWVHLLDEFLTRKYFMKFITKREIINIFFLFSLAYTAASEGSEFRVPCDFTKGPSKGKSCAVNVTQFGPCGPMYGYGFNTSSPCIFLKLNKVSYYLFFLS